MRSSREAANADLRKQTRDALAEAAQLRALLKDARALLVCEGDPDEDGEMIARIDEALK